MSVELRSATQEDTKDMMPLLRDLYQEDIGWRFPAILQEYISSDCHQVTVAIEDTRIVALLIGSYRLDIDYECRAGFIDAVAIHKNYRRQGIRKQLVRNFAEWARSRGCMVLQVDDRGSLFEEMGFRERRVAFRQMFIDEICRSSNVMSQVKTYGRRPTLGEIKEYYAREDVLESLNYACQKRKVIFSFRTEPSPRSEAGNPPLLPRDIDHLRQIIAEGIKRNMQSTADNARPSAYPSFHGMTANDGDVISDFVLEADCYDWRRSFVDVRGAVEILNEFRVPHIVKFSGHRSLHVMIPREAFPEEFNGIPMARAWKSLSGTLRRFFAEYAQVQYAHGTGGILRLPYSLNENTGLVSLPIAYEELDDFRPWEAILHLVGDVSQDMFDVSADGREKTSEFLHTALVERRISPLKGQMWRIRPKRNLSKYRQYMDDTPSINLGDPTERVRAAWRLMVNGERVSDETLKRYFWETAADVRWFIAEALMGDERASQLLYETSEYAASAIDDSVSLAPVPFLDMLLNKGTDWADDPGVETHVRSIFERAAGQLRDEIIQRSETVHEDKALTLIKCALALGGAGNEWCTAAEVAAILERRFPHTTDIIPHHVFSNIERLQNDGLAGIHEAEEALIAAGKRATDALILAMEDTNWTRHITASILCTVGDPKAIPTLVNALGDPRRRIRRMAVSWMLKSGHKVEGLKGMLLEATDSSNPRLRANALTILRLSDGVAAEALEVALRFLGDREPIVRRAAVKALARIGGPPSRDGLKRALADEDVAVAIRAAFALPHLGNDGERILKAALRSGSTQMARCAAHALLEMGDTSGVDLVMDAFSDDEWQVWCTPSLLARSGATRALETLLEFVERSLHMADMPPKALSVVRALGNCADRRAVDMLKRVMYARHDRISRLYATVTLGEIGTAEAMDVLLEALVGDDGKLRQQVAKVLIRMGAGILPQLRKLEEQTHGKPRRTLVHVLNSAAALESRGDDEP